MKLAVIMLISAVVGAVLAWFAVNVGLGSKTDRIAPHKRSERLIGKHGWFQIERKSRLVGLYIFLFQLLFFLGLFISLHVFSDSRVLFRSGVVWFPALIGCAVSVIIREHNSKE